MIGIIVLATMLSTTPADNTRDQLELAMDAAYEHRAEAVNYLAQAETRWLSRAVPRGMTHVAIDDAVTMDIARALDLAQCGQWEMATLVTLAAINELPEE